MHLRESNYYNLYELDRHDPLFDVCVDILTHEKIGNVLVVGYFNVKVDDNVIIVSDSMCGLEDCITSNYVRLKILNITHAFSMTKF